jgi:hypothetical protein
MDLIGIPELDFSTQNFELIYKGIEEIMTMEENIEGEVECEFINNSFEPYAENFIGINASHRIKSDFQDNENEKKCLLDFCGAFPEMKEDVEIEKRNEIIKTQEYYQEYNHNQKIEGNNNPVPEIKKDKEKETEKIIEKNIEKNNINENYLNDTNKMNKFHVFKVFNPSGQSKIHKEIRSEINSVVGKKPKKKECENDKFKIIDTNDKNENNKKAGNRKLKPDDIRKKIKARFLKSLRTQINEKLYHAKSEKVFDFLPQCFVCCITRKRNGISVLNMTFNELMTTDFFEKYKDTSPAIKSFLNKKREFDCPDKKKYKNNTNVIGYLEDNQEIAKKINFDIIQKMTYRELFDEYLKSKEFEEDILKLKNEEKEEQKYINNYIIKANNLMNYFSKSA